MTDFYVSDGQSTDGFVINNFDVQYVTSANNDVTTGGVTYHTTINENGLQSLVFGRAYDTVVNHGGNQAVDAGSRAYNTVLNGGQETVYSNHYGNDALADGTIINAGGQLNVYGMATNTTINAGGTMNLGYDPEHTDTSDIVKGITINDGGTLLIQYGTPSGIQLNAGGQVTFTHFDYQVGATTSLDQATDLLTITSGSQNYTLHLSGDYANTSFTVAAGSDGQVLVTALCFCRGTMILTPSGEVAVERLAQGDLVLDKDGHARPVRWIGRTATLVGPTNRPVIVRRGALGPDAPRRELRVTAGHAFLFGSVLIPIGTLANGVTILPDEQARSIELFHVELAAHVVLIADGALAESYRDDGNRAGFGARAGEHAPPRSMPTCAPVVSAGPIVERTRRRLAERARAAAIAQLRSTAA